MTFTRSNKRAHFQEFSRISMHSGFYHSHQGLIFLSHRGSSMRPTLVDSDLLEIQPYNGRFINPGDIIAFRMDVGEDIVVHRAVKVDDRGIGTRGDSNIQMDPWVIQPSSVLGRVRSARRGQKRIRIIGGRSGLIWSGCLQKVRKLDRRVSAWLHPIYRFLSEHGAITGLIPKRARPQLQTFISNGTACFRLTMGNRMVGWYDPELREWFIKRPFRLLVDERELESGKWKVESRKWKVESRKWKVESET